MRVYIDASAAVKLLLEEAETAALQAFCDRDDVELVATDLLETELRRIGQREGVAPEAVTSVLDGVSLHTLARSAYVEAGLLPGHTLRTLDALHLTGALRLEADVALIYDARMRISAVGNGIRVVAPGDPTWPAPAGS